MFHPHSLEEEQQLMLQVAEGSESATRKLVADHLNYVVSLAFRILGNRHDAEEIAQEVFLKLFKQAKTWEARAHISTWLYRITYNASIDGLRSRKRHDTYELKEFLINLEVEQEDFSPEDLEKLEQAMGQLPVQHRAALTIFYFQEKRTREAAEIMNLKEDAFESLLRRARKKLKNILEETNIYGGKDETEETMQSFIFRTGGTDAYQTISFF